ncbi:methyltransferase domain-containing protein [Streptomyces sp. NPDC051776]|uniref:methyltransferase domain-containing protein n=1 Tax=Streptomyces sp. NPDC051776 TaxID=3155414 RepID=UPI00342A916E
MTEAGIQPEAAAVARAALVRTIMAEGLLADPAWRAAFEDVPRHLFVPSYWLPVRGGFERLSYGDPDPGVRARWLAGAYADTPLATRVRDGALLSSSSQPSLMAQMLEVLEVRDGDRVLEIGTGTGFNAALISHRLGEERVTTVDLDREITESARDHLARAGYHPVVVRRDGARGCPSRAPYDRILATCALRSVPGAWLEQCRPGGLVVTPLATGLLALRVRGAAQAEGRFLNTSAYFVPLRAGGPASSKASAPREAPKTGEPPNVPKAAEVRGAPGPVSPGKALPGASPQPEDAEGVPQHLLRHEPFTFLLALTEGRLSPREAYELWQRAHHPERSRFGVTIRGAEQWAWLDDPDGPGAWPLGPAVQGATWRPGPV